MIDLKRTPIRFEECISTFQALSLINSRNIEPPPQWLMEAGVPGRTTRNVTSTVVPVPEPEPGLAVTRLLATVESRVLEVI